MCHMVPICHFSAGIFFPREGNTITTSPLPPPHCCHLRRCTVATFAAGTLASGEGGGARVGRVGGARRWGLASAGGGARSRPRTKLGRGALASAGWTLASVGGGCARNPGRSWGCVRLHRRRGERRGATTARRLIYKKIPTLLNNTIFLAPLLESAQAKRRRPYL